LDFLYMKFVKRRNKNESEVGREIRKWKSRLHDHLIWILFSQVGLFKMRNFWG
jgi:hypothetical protein